MSPNRNYITSFLSIYLLTIVKFVVYCWQVGDICSLLFISSSLSLIFIAVLFLILLDLVLKAEVFMKSNIAITRALFELGIKPRFKGFSILVKVLELTTEDPSYLYKTTTDVYPKIAQQLGVKTASIERNIRTALYNAFFQTARTPLAAKLFPNTEDNDPPTNSEFISTVTLYLLTNDINSDTSNMA